MTIRADIALAASVAALTLSVACFTTMGDHRGAVPAVAPAPVPAPVAAAPEAPSAPLAALPEAQPAPPAAVTPEQVRAALLAKPEILAEVANALQAKQEREQSEAARKAVAEAGPGIFEGFGVIGNPNGSKVVVEFFDYACGYCRSSKGDVRRLIEADGEAKLVLKEFPMLSEGSKLASKAAAAARLQGKYLEAHTALLGAALPLREESIIAALSAKELGIDIERLRLDMASPDVEKAVAESVAHGKALGVRGTPSFVSRDAGLLVGFGDDARFKEFLSRSARPAVE